MNMKITNNNNLAFQNFSTLNNMRTNITAPKNPETKTSNEQNTTKFDKISNKQIAVYSGITLGIASLALIIANRKKLGQSIQKLFNPDTNPPKTENNGTLEQIIESPLQKSSIFDNLQITPNDTQPELMKKVQTIINFPYKTEDALLEGLGWLEKNGNNFKSMNFSPYPNTHISFMDEVTSVVEAGYKPITNKILQKYLDIYNKFATPHNPKNNIKKEARENHDPANLTKLFYDYARITDKNTAFKFLEEIERTSLNYRYFHDFRAAADDLKIPAQDKEIFLQRVNEREEILRKLYKKSTAK